MPKFEVSFTESLLYNLIVEAKDAGEARRMVEEFEIDYDMADYTDSGGIVINNVTLYKE
jgi:hypothetical protein